MKKFFIVIIILVVASCISQNNAPEQLSELPNQVFDLIGTYVFETPEKSENHYIIIDTLDGKYFGHYFGTEDSGGHGVFFYKNDMQNLN